VSITQCHYYPDLVVGVAAPSAPNRRGEALLMGVIFNETEPLRKSVTLLADGINQHALRISAIRFDTLFNGQVAPYIALHAASISLVVAIGYFDLTQPSTAYVWLGLVAIGFAAAHFMLNLEHRESTVSLLGTSALFVTGAAMTAPFADLEKGICIALPPTICGPR
jgi:hypothetical protein